MTIVLDGPRELRASLTDVPRGLVPTMGALHDGHVSLIRRSAAENSETVVSIFVNPMQFTNRSDLAHYPRTKEADIEYATEAGATHIYAPPVDAVFPPGFGTVVQVGALASRWEGEMRPGHFDGVATAVTILLNTVAPDRTYLGEKDFQQLTIVRRLVRDLQLPGRIIGCETIRAPDGLALSSRNRRLSTEQRAASVTIPNALKAMAKSAASGERDAARVLAAGQAVLDAEPMITTEYLALVDPETLEPISEVAPGARALVAARVGEIRLIDNLDLLPVASSS